MSLQRLVQDRFMRLQPLVRAGVQPSNKFMPGQLLSYLPCAAGAAKILGLDAAKFRSVSSASSLTSSMVVPS